MEIINIEDQEDGSAMITFDLSEEEKEKLIEYALIDLLIKLVRERKDVNND